MNSTADNKSPLRDFVRRHLNLCLGYCDSDRWWRMTRHAREEGLEDFCPYTAHEIAIELEMKKR